MPTLTWAMARGFSEGQAQGDAVIMASRLELRSGADVLPFLLSALRVRRQMLRSPGNVGVSLIAKPLRKTFYTLSAWKDRAALDATITQEPHLKIMTKFRPRLAESAFTTWEAPVDRRRHPGWSDARRRLAKL